MVRNQNGKHFGETKVIDLRPGEHWVAKKTNASGPSTVGHKFASVDPFNQSSSGTLHIIYCS